MKPESGNGFRNIRIPGSASAERFCVILLGACIVSLPWTMRPSSNLYYDRQRTDSSLLSPQISTRRGFGSEPANWGRACLGNAWPAG